MVDVFISYARDQRALVEPIRAALVELGLTVFFDIEGIDGGDEFPMVLDRAVRAAKSVLGCFSPFAFTRRWVMKECGLALDESKLIAAAIEPIEHRDVPLQFYDVSREDLVDFAPETPSEGWAKALGGLARKLSAWAEAHSTHAEAAAALEKAAALQQAALRERRRLAEQGPAAAPAPRSPAAGGATAAETALRGIERSLDPDDYRDLEEMFPGTAEAFEARRRRRRLDAWAQVDRSDRAALAGFGRDDDFDALKTGVASALSDLERRAAERRQSLRSAPAGHRFRDTLRAGDDGPEMAVIPAGRFMMGSPDDEPGRYSDEGPQHEVAIAAPFALGRFAITRGEFSRFVAASGHDMSGGMRRWTGGEWKNDASRSWRDPGFEQDDRHPVVGVSWEDALAFCAWLSAEASETYRLPSEAEWECACRAGTTTPFWWGKTISPAQANYDGTILYDGGGEKGVWRQRTEPVDAFKPNAWGLHQTHGNVWEWCQDCWNATYDDAPDDGSAWMGGACSLAVLRGGSWDDAPRHARSALRLRFRRDLRGSSVGFRVALMLPL